MTIEKFLDSSYTAFHAVANAKQMLVENGFVQLDLKQNWNKSVKAKGKYFLTKNDSTLLAFVVGGTDNFAFNICLSHTDSPALKVKGGKTIVANGVTRLNVEKYGGGILHTFLDRKLKLAGRIFTSNNGKVESQLYASNFNVVVPSLCIHHNSGVNDNGGLNAQIDMLPILCQTEVDNLFSAICPDQNVLDADLYVVPCENSFASGVNCEFLSSPRIDNLTSVYGSIQGLLNSKPKNSIAVVYACDNEEIGNRTKQGAESSFLVTVLDKINSALGCSREQFSQACEQGFVLSIDNGHAQHPAHPEKSDLTNKVFPNGGIVIKHHSNYATDGQSAAILKNLLNAQGIAHQDYYNRSDLRCGSTLGCVVAAQLSMNVCDIGLAQYAMHSAVETLGTSDIETLTACTKALFESAN